MNSMRPKKVVHENNFTNTHIMSLMLGILSQKECSRAVLKNLHALNVRRKKINLVQIVTKYRCRVLFLGCSMAEMIGEIN